MKKTFLYAFAAVGLGVGIMLFPLWTFFRSYNEEGPIGFRDSTPYIKSMTASENWQNYTRAQTGGVPTYGDSKVPTQPIDSSLQILAVGFIAAMAVYLIVRRRVPRLTPTIRFPPC